MRDANATQNNKQKGVKMIRQRIHLGIPYTICKLDDGTYQAAYRSETGAIVYVRHNIMRVAEGCIQAHIEDMVE
jgi:hypothetical protein